jgi:type II secretion system protein N
MTPQTKRIVRAVLFPLFYLWVLLVFLYLTFPYDRLKDRLVAEFNSRQPAGAGTRLEIAELDGYWLSGVEAEGVKLVSPPRPAAAGEEEDKKKKPEPKVVTIDHVHVRVSLLRLLFGTTHVSFGGDAFGGKLGGFTSDSRGSRLLEVELDQVGVGELPLLGDIVGLPMTGALSGTIDLTLPEQKLSQAEGVIQLTATDVTIGDGKAKIRDTISLPKLDAGELTFDAAASKGQLDVQKLSVKGKDFELQADGKIRLRDPFETSLLELNLRFSFTDAYKNRNDMTRGLFGPAPGVPGLFDMDPKTQRAKRPDGFYAFRVTGPIGSPETHPASLGAGAGSPRRPRR